MLQPDPVGSVNDRIEPEHRQRSPGVPMQPGDYLPSAAPEKPLHRKSATWSARKHSLLDLQARRKHPVEDDTTAQSPPQAAPDPQASTDSHSSQRRRIGSGPPPCLLYT